MATTETMHPVRQQQGDNEKELIRLQADFGPDGGFGSRSLVVTRGANEQDVMTLKAEVGRAEASTQDGALAGRIADTLSAQTKLRGEVHLVAPGSLPNDGRVIADERTYG